MPKIKNVPSKKYQSLHWSNSYFELPSGWSFERVGNYFDEHIELSSDLNKFPLHSFTIENGVTPKSDRYERSFLLKDQENNEYKVIRKGQLIFNPMNIRFGAVDIYFGEKPVSVSAYYSIANKNDKDIDLNFLQEYLKSPYLIDLYNRMATGSLLEKRRVHWSMFKDFYLPIPPYKEQLEISHIFFTWNKAIETVEKLIQQSQQQKKALMQQLLTGERRLPGYTEEWCKTEFCNIASLTKKKYDPKKVEDSYACIELEHLSQGTGQCLGTVDSKQQLSTKTVFQKDDVLFGKLRPYLRKYWLADTDGVCSTEIWALKANNKKCLPEYLFHLVQTEKFIQVCNVSSGSRMPRADWSYVSEIPFELPDITEQKDISAILDKMDATLANLYTQHKDLISQKIALMQQLLTGKRRVNVT